MKKIIIAFLCGGMCIVSAFAESFLKATKFPKTFEDLSFKSRVAVLRDGYAPYDIEYDDNGVCVSGCAYKGITFADTMRDIDEANAKIAQIIEDAIKDSQKSDDYPTTDDTEKSDDDSQSDKNTDNTDESDNDSPSETTTTDDNKTIPDKKRDVPETDWCRNGLPTDLPLRYPVDMTNFQYKITSDFGLRNLYGKRLHGGIDIDAPMKTPVYATAAGVILEIKEDATSGKYITIKHKNNLLTQYLHLNDNSSFVSVGQSVQACQKIGLTGNTGRTTGPHLDYRVRFANSAGKKTDMFVDILCPCKAAVRQETIDGTTKRAVGGKTGISPDLLPSPSCKRSLFYNKYKITGSKHTDWRIEYGHCMSDRTDLLPDEVKK